MLNKPTLFSCLFVFTVLISACAQKPQPPKQTTRICDDSGCSERSIHSSTFTPEPAMDADTKVRMEQLIVLAKKDPRAAYDLGLRFFRGDGVKRDSYQAIKWMRHAADRGDLPAQKALGKLYLTGLEEMGADYREAEKWLTIAVGQGDEESKELLKKASLMKKRDTDYYRWQQERRSYFYRNWYSGWPYRYRWHRNGWAYYNHPYYRGHYPL